MGKILKIELKGANPCELVVPVFISQIYCQNHIENGLFENQEQCKWIKC